MKLSLKHRFSKAKVIGDNDQMASAKRPTYARIKKKTHRFVGEAGGEPYTKKAYTTSCSYDVGVQRASVGIYSLFCFGGGGWIDSCRNLYYLSNPNTPNICIPQAQDTESAMHHDSQLDAHKDGIYWEHPGVISRSTNK